MPKRLTDKQKLYNKLKERGIISGKIKSYTYDKLKLYGLKKHERYDASIHKLSPAQLESYGYSRRSERYITSDGEILSKRQAQKRRKEAGLTRAAPEKAIAAKRRTKTIKYKNSKHIVHNRATLEEINKLARKYQGSSKYKAFMLDGLFGNTSADAMKYKIVVTSSMTSPETQAHWASLTGGMVSMSLLDPEFLEEMEEEAMDTHGEGPIEYSLILIKKD